MNNVYNTRFSEQVRALHGALLDVIVVMNRPQGDEKLIAEAGIALDGALFRLLVGVERFGPIGVVELAERAGRDYTTVSRQVARLESLGLVERRPGAADKRVREAVISPAGKTMTDRIDAARERMAAAIFADWPPGEVEDLARLLRKFADALAD
ncbi:MarR family winged helix-turn-helix transcriptional regulator [Sphingomonas psychrotolerans]|uniref:MarR family winged helix-turn-helix transcriptional regulator n=1 Tax=Sphingomonas psychrotolerans TaxID=1327635 RepID=A0ABU3N4V6_9SPHN|nr:MarR family winged helix-turn-helix transcriptional regulator [Sphingomonas psychrotolerans]MDT8759567.1 MarR family winged helix-turn-helix transcriptional regulator [Sphingomonas psychrotolerans]